MADSPIGPQEWRLPVEDLQGREITGITHLTPSIVRFRYSEPQPMPDMLTALIEDHGDIGRISPEAPNRDAVAYNYRQSKSSLQEEFEDFRRLGDEQFATWNSLLRLNADHVFRPDYIYTNGQSVVTRIDRDEHIEMVHHNSGVFGFADFRGSIAVHEFSFKPDGVAMVESERHARLFVQRTLAPSKEIELTATDGKTEVPLAMRVVWYGFSGYIVRMGDRHLLLRDGPSIYLVNAMKDLATRLDGFYPKCCATCVNLRMSGMSMDMSKGSNGYCTAMSQDRGTEMFGPGDVVSVLDLCDDYEHRED